MSEWISVKDRFPDDQQRVLGWLSNCAHILLWYANNEFEEVMVDCYKNIKHVTKYVSYWMPLPEAPSK